MANNNKPFKPTIYKYRIGGNLIGEFPSADMHIIVEDPKFPGVQGFPRRFTFRDQYTIVGPNYSRETDNVIMRMDPTKFPEVFAALDKSGNGASISALGELH